MWPSACKNYFKASLFPWHWTWDLTASCAPPPSLPHPTPPTPLLHKPICWGKNKQAILQPRKTLFPYISGPVIMAMRSFLTWLSSDRSKRADVRHFGIEWHQAQQSARNSWGALKTRAGPHPPPRLNRRRSHPTGLPMTLRLSLPAFGVLLTAHCSSQTLTAPQRSTYSKVKMIRNLSKGLGKNECSILYYLMILYVHWPIYSSIPPIARHDVCW